MHLSLCCHVGFIQACPAAHCCSAPCGGTGPCCVILEPGTATHTLRGGQAVHAGNNSITHHILLDCSCSRIGLVLLAITLHPTMHVVGQQHCVVLFEGLRCSDRRLSAAFWTPGPVMHVSPQLVLLPQGSNIKCTDQC
jgi:hypothetical protein